MSDDLEVQEFALFDGDPDELLEVIVKRGNDVRRIQAHTVMVVATSRGSDRTWNVVLGQAELLGRIFATTIRMAVKLDELDAGLCVQLIRDYAGTARAIGSAFIRHSQWENRKHGQAQGGPGPHAGGEGRTRPGGPGAGS